MQNIKNQEVVASSERGDLARQKLLDAALKVFGQYGFEGASTRSIAAEAGTNIAAIPYYFGGKEGLYLAAVDHIVYLFEQGPGQNISQINARLEENIGDSECRALLSLFVRTLLEFILDGPKNSIYVSRIVVREQLDPTAAFDRLYNGMLRSLHRTLRHLVSRLTGDDADSPEAILRAQALFGQIVTFKSSRETVLRNLGWSGYGKEEINAIARVIEVHIDAILGARASR